MASGEIGRYQIIRPLGAGGMAEVYLAHDPVLGRDVAIKIPHPEKLDAAMLARFMREATTVARLEHPAIVPLYDVGDHDGRPYLVMRYMPGGTLAERIERRTFDLRGALGIVERVAAALDHAHRHGVLHRDVKPGNILFDEAGQAYLSDFTDLNPPLRSDVGMSIGHVELLSPEQIRGRGMRDGRSNIYSLGVILFWMLTGSPPFDDPNKYRISYEKLHSPVPKIHDPRPDLPPSLQTVIDRVLAVDPQDRYPTGAALVADLRRVSAGRRPARLVSPTRRRSRFPAWGWLVALVALAVVAYLVLNHFLAPSAAVPPALPLLVPPALILDYQER